MESPKSASTPHFATAHLALAGRNKLLNSQACLVRLPGRRELREGDDDNRVATRGNRLREPDVVRCCSAFVCVARLRPGCPHCLASTLGPGRPNAGKASRRPCRGCHHPPQEGTQALDRLVAYSAVPKVEIRAYIYFTWRQRTGTIAQTPPPAWKGGKGAR